MNNNSNTITIASAACLEQENAWSMRKILEREERTLKDWEALNRIYFPFRSCMQNPTACIWWNRWSNGKFIKWIKKWKEIKNSKLKQHKQKHAMFIRWFFYHKWCSKASCTRDSIETTDIASILSRWLSILFILLRSPSFNRYSFLSLQSNAMCLYRLNVVVVVVLLLLLLLNM